MKGTRPTSERAREALFNSLTGLIDIDGARVLDLFAGTGAVGLEALSRGAQAVTLVESDRGACDIIRRNITAVGLPDATLVRRAAAPFLAGGSDAPFDLVFIDPPYALSEPHMASLLAQLAGADWVVPDGVVVVERSARSPEPVWPDEFEVTKQRRYGEGVLWYRRRR